MNKIKVALKENSYNVIVGKNIVGSLQTEIENLGLNKNILVVIDENVARYHLRSLKKIFKRSGRKINFYLLKPGERSKSYVELNKIYSFLLQNGYGRDTLIIGIGGGVAGDLVGYTAATFMRGVQLVHIPTTLLAAVDSAIGGKTGINFENKKNMIGAFYQPRMVLVDTEFFKTLPVKEQTSGIGEIIKYGYLADSGFFKYLDENILSIYEEREDIIKQIIVKCISIKAAVVSQDEKESGLRKILNLGHTFAHGFETDLNFKVKHGEAVIAGVVSAIYLANSLGLLRSDLLEDFLALPLKIKLPASFRSLDIKNVMEIMRHDKKNKNGRINFVLPAGTGKILLDIEANSNSIRSSLLKMKNKLHY